MSVTLKSTSAKILDAQKVREVIDSYEVRGVEIDVREKENGWVLEMAFRDDEDISMEFPAAIRTEQLPGSDQFGGDDDVYSDALDEAFQEKGGKGSVPCSWNRPRTSTRR